MVQHDVEEVVKFILQYAEANTILLPGRIPGYKRDNIEILPSSTTKRAVWEIYEETATTYSMSQVSYPTWCRCWSHFARHVVVGRPMSDLCLVCQQNSTAIVRSANLSEEEKSEVGCVSKVKRNTMFAPHYTLLFLFVCRPSRQLKHTYGVQHVSGHTTVQLLMSVKVLFMHNLLPALLHLRFLLLPLVPPSHLEVDLLAYIIHLILPSRFTTLPIPFSQAQCSSRQHGSMPSLVFAAKAFRGK